MSIIYILAFLIWFIPIVLFVILVVPIYLVFLLYLGLRFVATNIFVGMDKLFYLGFDVSVVIIWVFWGFVIGASIQGCRELRSIYGRKWIGILILLTPILLLTLVGVIKNVTDSTFREHNTSCYGAEHRWTKKGINQKHKEIPCWDGVY